MKIEEFVGAARKGDAEKLKKALSAQPGLGKERDPRGDFTALHWAAAYDRVECVMALLPFSDPTARIGAQDQDRRKNALMIAAEEGAVKSLRALLPHSDVNALNDEGQTALMLATLQNEIECVKALIPHSNQKIKKHGKNALDWAIKLEHWECADALAASKSKRAAKNLIKTVPKDAPLPLCNAFLESVALRKEVATAHAKASSPGQPTPKDAEASHNTAQPKSASAAESAGKRVARKPRRI